MADDILKRLREAHDSDHARGCDGRFYQCSCGYDAEVIDVLDMAADEIERLRAERDELRRLLNLMKAEMRAFIDGAPSPAGSQEGRDDG